MASALVENSRDKYPGWGDVVIFAAVTAARIGEVSGVRVCDIDRANWTWTVRRQTTPGPGGLIDKGTKGKRARTVPLIEEVRDMVAHRLDQLGDKPDARLFVGPRGGRITQQFCGTPPAGMRWWRSSATSTSAATIYATPA